jgi:DNA-binding GntR family transcriptional regulator
VCGKIFVGKGGRSIYCSARCKLTARNEARARRLGTTTAPARPPASGTRSRSDSAGPQLYRELVRNDVTEITTAEARERLGLSDTGTRKHLREMAALGLLERVAYGRYRVLPPRTPAASDYLRHVL